MQTKTHRRTFRFEAIPIGPSFPPRRQIGSTSFPQAAFKVRVAASGGCVRNRANGLPEPSGADMK
eukprot:5277128-Amphidinium_carterae.1